MEHILDKESDEWFADYLDRVGNDMAESGSEATADDYHMAAKRIRQLPSAENSSIEDELFDFGGQYCDWEATGNKWIEAINSELSVMDGDWEMEIHPSSEDGDGILWRIVKK